MLYIHLSPFYLLSLLKKMSTRKNEEHRLALNEGKQWRIPFWPDLESINLNVWLLLGLYQEDGWEKVSKFREWKWFSLWLLTGWIKGSYHFLNKSWMSVRSGWQQVYCYPGRSGNTVFGREELGKKEGGMWAGRGEGREKESILPDHHQQKIQLSIF